MERREKIGNREGRKRKGRGKEEGRKREGRGKGEGRKERKGKEGKEREREGRGKGEGRKMEGTKGEGRERKERGVAMPKSCIQKLYPNQDQLHVQGLESTKVRTFSITLLITRGFFRIC